MLNDCIEHFPTINTPPRHHPRAVTLFQVVKAIFDHEPLAPTALHGAPSSNPAIINAAPTVYVFAARYKHRPVE
jgi:hypothetical protein